MNNILPDYTLFFYAYQLSRLIKSSFFCGWSWETRCAVFFVGGRGRRVVQCVIMQNILINDTQKCLSNPPYDQYVVKLREPRASSPIIMTMMAAAVLLSFMMTFKKGTFKLI